MKIKDLIEKLKQFNPEQSVACYTEDEGLKHDGGPVQIFEILNISESEAESRRVCRILCNRGWGYYCGSLPS